MKTDWTDWGTLAEGKKLAKESHYRVEEVARKLGISLRWFEKVCAREFGKTPHALFAEWRAREIEHERSKGKLGKEMLDDYGLKHPSSLTRALKRNAGHGLRRRQQRRGDSSQKANKKSLTRARSARQNARILWNRRRHE